MGKKEPVDPFGPQATQIGTPSHAARQAYDKWRESKRPKPAESSPVGFPVPTQSANYPQPYNPSPVITGERSTQSSGSGLADAFKWLMGTEKPLPTVPKPLIWSTAVIGLLMGLAIGVSHASPLLGAFYGGLAGLFSVPITILAFRVASRLLIVALVIFILYVIVHSLSH